MSFLIDGVLNVLKIAKVMGNGGACGLERKALSFASDANKTLLSSEYDGNFLDVVSGVSLTATRDLILPLVAGLPFIIRNGTTGGQSIRAIGASGTGVTITNGSVGRVICDGTNWIAW